MFDFQEAATACAKGAERILGEDIAYINQNHELIPVFVSLLFQSIEISLKHLGLEANLFTEKEARDRKLTKNGHGIREIAELINMRLGGDKDHPVIMALTAGLDDSQIAEIVDKMIFGQEFESTRKAYQSRNLGYAQLNQGDMALVQELALWSSAVKDIAQNLPRAIGVVREWRSSASKSKHFAIWNQKLLIPLK